MAASRSYLSKARQEDASGSNFTGAEALAFTPPNSKTWWRAWVWNKPTSGVTLTGLWNDDSSSPTVLTTGQNSSFVLAPGDMIAQPDGVGIDSIGIYSSGAATLGTDFIVAGYPDTVS